MVQLPQIVIIWCDITFENEHSYKSMKDDFSTTTAAAPKTELESINKIIAHSDKEKICSNNVSLITVQTVDEAMKKIEENNKKKTFVIASGSVGRHLVPAIIYKHPHVHDFYIFAHNITLHLDWGERYRRVVKMFDFPTDLLIRVTRDIASYLIELGETYLTIDVPETALPYFIHARNLEMYANQKDRMEANINDTERYNTFIECRHNLNLLEGDNGLIAQAEAAIREKECPLQNV